MILLLVIIILLQIFNMYENNVINKNVSTIYDTIKILDKQVRYNSTKLDVTISNTENIFKHVAYGGQEQTINNIKNIVNKIANKTGAH